MTAKRAPCPQIFAVFRQLVLALCLAIAINVNADAGEISAKGEVNFKITVNGTSGQIRGDELDGWTIARSGDEAILKNGAGGEIGRAVKQPDGTLRMEVNGKTTCQIGFEGETYRIYTYPDKTLIYRVKIKDDKYNIYDRSDKRILHGKQKEDGGWGVKPEKGEQILKLKGPASLREASYLSVPLEASERVLLWASQTL